MWNYYWNDRYMNAGWFLWFGVVFLFFAGMANWAYTYSAHQKFLDKYTPKDELDILNEGYARGSIE